MTKNAKKNNSRTAQFFGRCSVALKKWKESGGETLVECLCAILIISLTSAILMGGIVTASKLNGMAKNLDAKYQVECNDAETSTAMIEKNVTINGITKDGSGGKSQDVDVYFNTNDPELMQSYRLKTTP